MLKQLPFLLVWSRLLAGMVILMSGLLHVSFYSVLATCLIVFGLVSDILDGIIARRLGVSTEKLRRLDSSIDQAFWLMVILSLIIVYPSFFRLNLLKIIVLAAAEGLTYVISYARFRKEVATHAIASKVWTLTLFITLIQVVLTGTSFL
jgi:phosphatidylglycerophosphate synthase